MSENKFNPEDFKKKPGIRHVRAIGLVIGRQIEMSREAAKKGGSLKDAASMKVNEDSEFMDKVKKVWNGEE